jgi:hypothetical protein
MVSSGKPFLLKSFKVLRKMANRASSLRGRPGGRPEFPPPRLP